MMDEQYVTEAAALLVEARRSGRRLIGLPPVLQPQTVAVAHAIQDAVTKTLGEEGGGWKANAPTGGELQRGLIFARLIFASPARIPASLVPLCGIEAEIAFRFLRELPPRDAAYEREEVAGVVSPLPAIEVVDSRYRDFNACTPLERLADHALNGAFVAGAELADWRRLDLARLRVTLSFDDTVIVDRVGGHPTGDPLATALAFVNAMRAGEGVRRGELVTTGSCTGMNFAKAGTHIMARFEGLGEAEVSFEGG